MLCMQYNQFGGPSNETVYGELAASQDGTSKLQHTTAIYNIYIYSCMYSVVYTHIDRFQFCIYLYIVGVYDISVYDNFYIHMI